ncbi:hypothetical protein GCM10009122_57570 [Fulvivirga kasyanovii]|uniref:Outer membrane protein beta-barrel domain-containing protein n=1 Tax=Fulvivirga kasyanovii TaxID=396812 RepID=A0ABW9RIN8_9BACT|nr:hypothetical protein [Fulvivirga kasyanovii]MTI23932.1 hypothetical protein [Fulvivirga kasyanovii]
MRYILITIFCINTLLGYSQVENNPEQISNNRIGTSRTVPAYILSGLGGALIGIPLGQEAGQRTEANWLLAGAGVGLITSAFPVLFGDDLNISVRAVRGNYKMERMKSLLPGGFYQYGDLGLPYDRIESYPSSTGYEVTFSGSLNRWVIGTKVALRSTQGKLEYNGAVNFEDNLRDWEIGEFVKYNFISRDKIKAAIGLNIGMGETTSESTVRFLLNGQPSFSSDKTEFLNIYLGPEISVNYYLGEVIFLNALMGYDHHIVKKHLYTYGVGVERETDWSGIRYGLGFGIKFSRN